MGSSSICLSSASILRCTSLSQLQHVLLVIPTALEVLFSTSLIFTNRDEGRKHLLITAEGWIYLILSALELLSNVAPAVRESLTTFKAFDLGIGVASFLPLFFYTFFFFLFTSSALLETLPKSISHVAKYSLILFIPAIVIFNEIGSFIGVVIRETVLPGKPVNSQRFVQFFFTSDHTELLWSFFTSVTLALLTAFQAAVFSFAFFRFVRAILHQRTIENQGSDKAVFLNGIVWLCAALKIGALESLIGFASGGFAIALARRIMRMMSRACLCVGVVKGVDVVEDFQIMQREMRTIKEKKRDQRISRLRLLISNPRNSTFRQLSPTAAAFHANPRAVQNLVSVEKDESAIGQRPHYITWSQRQSQATIQSGLPGMKDFASIKEEKKKQRVTVLYHDGTPKLHMRLSTLDVPSPALIVESVKSRPQSDSEWIGSVQNSTPYQSGFVSEYTYDEKKDGLVPPMPQFHDHVSSDYRDSLNSFMSSPYEIIDARKLPQTVAIGQLYQTPTGDRTTQTGGAVMAMAFPEPTYRSSSPPQVISQADDTDADRIKSVVSSKSKTDSITAAVRDLANQFPGPPDISRIRPSENRVIPEMRAPLTPLDPYVHEKSVWEEDSRTSAQYLSGGAMPLAVGSPSEFTFGKRSRRSSALGMADDLVYQGSHDGSSLMFAEPSPVKAGKVPVMGTSYRASIASRKSKRSFKEKADTDVLNGEDDYQQLSKAPVSVPLGIPLQQSLSVADTPVPIIRKAADSPETPTTGFSGFSRIRESVPPSRADSFVDFAMALDTGKSKQFKVTSMPPLPQAPTSARSKTVKSEEKLSRVAAWVDTSAKVAVARGLIDPELPVTQEELADRPIIQGRPRDNSLQNLHDRGKSIDALSIAWIKGPEGSEGADARAAGRKNASYESSALNKSASKIKTVGKVKNRTTPAPVTPVGHMRGSLYLEPIIIPPRNGNMPQIEYSSPDDVESEKNVLRDDEVLIIESVMGTRKTKGADRF